LGQRETEPSERLANALAHISFLIRTVTISEFIKRYLSQHKTIAPVTQNERKFLKFSESFEANIRKAKTADP